MRARSVWPATPPSWAAKSVQLVKRRPGRGRTPLARRPGPMASTGRRSRPPRHARYGPARARSTGRAAAVRRKRAGRLRASWRHSCRICDERSSRPSWPVPSRWYSRRGLLGGRLRSRLGGRARRRLRRLRLAASTEARRAAIRVDDLAVATFAIGTSGHRTRRSMSIGILALSDSPLSTKLSEFRRAQAARITSWLPAPG